MFKSYYWQHRDKCLANSRAWKKSNPAKVAEHNRKYGLTKMLPTGSAFTADDFARLLRHQNNCCGICGSESPGAYSRFSIDHDHKTGQVRGLLCTNCNHGLGKFRDDQAVLERAKLYLAMPPASLVAL